MIYSTLDQLITDFDLTENTAELGCYDYNPAISSNAFYCEAWKASKDRTDHFLSRQPTLDNYLRYLDTIGN